MGKAPVYTFPVNRKSTFAPMTNQVNISSSESQSSGPKKATKFQAIPKSGTLLKKSSPTAEGKTLSTDKSNSSPRENQKFVEQATTITWTTSRRMTRSQSMLLAKPPVNIGKRKSGPTKMRKQHLADQVTSKKTKSKKSQTTVPTNGLPKDMSTSESVIAAAYEALPTARLHETINVVKVDSDETHPIASVSPSVLRSIAYDAPRRTIRSQSVLLTKSPVNIGRRYSLPDTMRIQYLADQVAPNKITAKIDNTLPTSLHDVAESTRTTSTTSTKPKCIAEAQSLSKDKSKTEAVLGEGKSVPTTGLDSNANVSTEHFRREETESIASSLNSQLTLGETVAANDSPMSPRRSTRSTKSLMQKKLKDINRKIDSLSLSPTRPFKVAHRRNTVKSRQSTADESVANASTDQQGTSANTGTKAASVQSNVVKRTSSVKPVQRRSKSSLEISTKATIDEEEDVVITFTENQGVTIDLTANAVSETGTGEKSHEIGRPVSAKPAYRKGKPTEDIPPRIKHKENGTVFIKIPDDLRKVLTDDLKFINSAKRLYEIPSEVNVAQVVDEYVTMLAENRVSDSCNPSPMTSKDFFVGIIEYFDRLLGNQLLYEPERDQHLSIKNDFVDVAMSKIYPPIYLLRLLVRLNNLLHFNNTSQEIMKFSMDQLDKFVKYLSDNRSTYFETPC